MDISKRIGIEYLTTRVVSFKWMHEKSYKLFNACNQIFGVTHILTQGAALVFTIMDILNKDTYNVYLIVFMSIALFIGGIKQFYKFEEKAERHRSAAIKFSLFHDNIVMAQHNSFEEGRNKKTIKVNWFQKEFQKIVIASPNINTVILWYFERTFKQKPDSAQDLESGHGGVSVLDNGNIAVANPDLITTTTLEQTDQMKYELERYIENEFNMVC